MKVSSSVCGSSTLRRVVVTYIKFVEGLSVAAVALLVIVAAYQVFSRYVLESSLFWSEELMRYLMVWTTFLIAGITYSRGGFLGMQFIVAGSPAWIQKVADIFGRIAILAFLLTVAWYGFEFAARTAENEAVALQISMFWIHVSVPVGCVLMALHVMAGFFIAPSDALHSGPRELI